MAFNLKHFFDLGFTPENISPPDSPRERKEQQALQGVGVAVAAASVTVVSLVALMILFGALATLMAFLRSRKNPTYWQGACWILLAVGISGATTIFPEPSFGFERILCVACSQFSGC